MDQTSNSAFAGRIADAGLDYSPILIVPYMWIGDFVRCHTVIQLLRARFPDRPVDMLTTTLCAPLTEYMPGLRQAIVADLPRKSLALAQQKTLAARLRQESYGTALIMPRTWKAALAPFFAGIPERTGFIGEARFFLLNDLRDAILALATAATAVSNDSGLLHVAAALGTPAIGIFGPTSPWHWAPLNPLAATMETKAVLDCRPCHKPTCRLGHHRCMREIGPDEVFAATRRALAAVPAVS